MSRVAKRTSISMSDVDVAVGLALISFLSAEVRVRFPRGVRGVFRFGKAIDGRYWVRLFKRRRRTKHQWDYETVESEDQIPTYERVVQIAKYAQRVHRIVAEVP